METIGLFAFYNTGLESVEFPESLRTVAQGAFSECMYLKSVKFCEGLEVLGTEEYEEDGKPWRGVFEESALENIELPSTLRRIEYDAFMNCKGI